MPFVDGAVGMDRWGCDDIALLSQDVYTWHRFDRTANIAARMAEICMMAACGQHHGCRRHRQALKAVPALIAVHVEHDYVRHTPRNDADIARLAPEPVPKGALAGDLLAVACNLPLAEGGFLLTGPERNDAEPLMPVGKGLL